MTNLNKILLYILWIIPLSSVIAGGKVVLVGGGQKVDNSQVSIELNMKWVREVLNKKNKDIDLNMYFTDGTDPSDDIKEWKPVDDRLKSLQPLANVFGNGHENGYKFRSSKIQGVEGGTAPEYLIPALKKIFRKLRDKDSLLFLFYGHGSDRERNEMGNGLRLWESTELSVQEIRDLFDEVDKDVPIRFVLPQCYSGDFERLIYKGAAKRGRDLEDGVICGFMSVAKGEQSEGCTTSIDTGDYRDYTTFFFNALAGEDRLGNELLIDPDRNSDGQVSFLEAHYYAVTEAESADIPRSTSETFLERWEPWYIRWSGELEADNVYTHLASRIMNRYKLPVDKEKIDRQIFEMIRGAKRELDALKTRKDELAASIEQTQRDIKKDLYFRWPFTRYPYTKGFSNFLLEDVSEAQKFIMQHNHYQQLLDMQKKYEQAQQDELNQKRYLAQLRRIARLRRLGLLLALFENRAAENDKEAYNKILACEQVVLEDM